MDAVIFWNRHWLEESWGLSVATTLDEYQNILKRQSTRKTFQKIIIEEPDTESAISILRGIKDKYRDTP
jgi:ATP-dependent Clp protease ATP-binding subunit ClpA